MTLKASDLKWYAEYADRVERGEPVYHGQTAVMMKSLIAEVLELNSRIADLLEADGWLVIREGDTVEDTAVKLARALGHDSVAEQIEGGVYPREQSGG